MVTGKSTKKIAGMQILRRKIKTGTKYYSHNDHIDGPNICSFSHLQLSQMVGKSEVISFK
jgi:hypothetical protein